MTHIPSPNRYNPLAVVGVFALALIGVAFLVLAVVLLVRGTGGAASAASPTRPAIAVTQVALVPTTTQSPPTATQAATEAPTAAAPAVSDTPAASATAAPLIKIVKPAN